MGKRVMIQVQGVKLVPTELISFEDVHDFATGFLIKYLTLFKVIHWK